uniref:Ribosome biogenesis regulatory protein n=1 Tax=Dermatophagoides pteronyssinus TaxID=6956 RepID=A0A6P6YFI4_DERPT|nr:ribosome biogenesis regulatory protein homolog [Dermatophagoides pteronyssinus]
MRFYFHLIRRSYLMLTTMKNIDFQPTTTYAFTFCSILYYLNQNSSCCLEEIQIGPLLNVENLIDLIGCKGILQKASDDELKAQQLVNVDSKQIDLTYDLAHLAAFDPNLYPDLKTLKSEKLLPKQIVYNLPRAKPIPKPKPPTKWEQFARSKGITKKKKERMVWDTVNNEWMIEVPDQADPNVDYFAKKSEERNERVAKNELQRLRNISRNLKLRLPGTSGILPNLDTNQTKTEQLIQSK